MSKPVLLGEAPSRSGDSGWQYPLWGNSTRLCQWAGWDPAPDMEEHDGYYAALTERFDVRNLLQRWPGEQGRGAAFPVEQARPAWQALRNALGDAGEDQVMVLLGHRLARLVGIESYVARHEWTTLDGWLHVVYVPHPSGLNRVYNDPEERRRTGATLREAVKRAK